MCVRVCKLHPHRVQGFPASQATSPCVFQVPHQVPTALFTTLQHTHGLCVLCQAQPCSQGYRDHPQEGQDRKGPLQLLPEPSVGSVHLF